MSGKRRRSSSRSPSAPKKSPKASAGPNATLSAWKILRILLDITDTRTSITSTDGRWSELVKVWNDPSLTLEMPKRGVPALDRPILDAYHCLLASQLLDRLVSQHKNDKSPELLVIVAALADLLSKMIGLDHSLSPSEEAWKNSASRSILSWIVLSSAISSLYVVQTASENLSEDARFPMVLDASLTTLQRLVVSNNTLSSTSTEMDWTDSSLCLEAISQSYSLETPETALVLALEEWDEGTTASSNPSSKRSTRRSSSSPKSSRRKDATSLFQSLRGLFGGSKQALIPVLINGTPSPGCDLPRVLASTTLRFHSQGLEPLLQAVYQLASSDSSSGNVPWTRTERMQLILRMFHVATVAGELSRSPPMTILPATPFLLDFMEFKGRGTPAWQTKDIREWATRAVYQTFQFHHESLLQDPSYVKRIHDEPPKEKTSGTCVPNLSSLLDSLTRVVSFSISGMETSSPKHEVTAKSLFAVLWFQQMITHPQIPALDYSLTQFALQNLVLHLKALQEEQSTASSLPRVSEEGGDHAEDLEEIFELSEPVPIPTAPRVGTMDTGSSMTASLNDTYAGMWTLRSKFSHEDALSLFLRVVGEEGKSTSTGDTFSWGYNLIGKLCQIATLCCQNSNGPSSNPEEEEQEETKSPKGKGSRKRAIKGGSKGNKRRKTDMDTESSTSGADDKNRLTQPQARVIAEALSALVHCLTILESPVSDLAHSIHRGFKLSQGKEVLKLGILVDHTIMASRSPSLEQYTARDVATDVPREADNNIQDFEHSLWSSNIRLAQVLGRGQVPFSANLTGVFSDSDRKSLFQSLAGGRKKEWSLQLSPASLTFLVAELTCYPRLGDSNGAEMFLVKACIKSIIHLLSRMDSFSQPDVGIPLGHRDAQVLLLAFSRLSTDKQRKVLEDFMHEAIEQLAIISKNKEMRTSLSTYAEASAFIARLVVVISSMRYLFIYGVPLREVLFSSTGQHEVLMPECLHQSKWHCQRRTFLGLFRCWERASLPELCSLSAGSLFRGEILGHRVKDPKFFEMAFSLGLGTAQSDGSYLMLAAWNELGKLNNEGYLAELTSDQLSLHTTIDNIPKRILELREVLRSIQGSRHDEDTGVETRGGKYIVSVLTNAEELFAKIREMIDQEDFYDDQDKCGPVVALLGALPVFVAAVAASCTREGNDHFSPSLKKARKSIGSRGTGASTFELGKLEQDSYTAFRRLAERCDKLGFAPIHPDWLDVSCRFEMDTADAIECANRASRLLSQVIQTSVDQCRKHQMNTMQLGCSDSSADVIQETANYLRSEVGLTSASYQESAVPSDICSNASMTALSENVHSARGQWCQDISFRFNHAEPMDSSERFTAATLRASGEWDVLFNEALAGVGIMSRGPGTTPENPSNLTGRNILPRQIAAIWRSNLEVACSSLIPVTALLRAAVSERGRRPHPCSFLHCEPDSRHVQDFLLHDVAGIRSRDTSSIAKETPEGLVRALLACSPLSGGHLFRDCVVASGNVFPDTAQFSNMQKVYTSQQALFRVKDILQLSDLPVDKDMKSSISVLLEGLMSRVESIWFKYYLTNGCGSIEEVETIMGKCRVPSLSNDILVDPKLAIANLVRLVTGDENIVSDSCRVFLNTLLISLLREDGKIREAALTSFGQLNASAMETWIRLCLGCNTSSSCDSEKAIASTCTLLHLALQPQDENKHIQHVHGVLLDMLNNFQFNDHAFGCAVDVLLVAAAHTGKLKATELALLQACKKGQDTASQDKQVAILHRFTEFVAGQQHSSSAAKVAGTLKKQPGDSRQVKLPISCSFAEKSGYHGQHWYNCYTCGLVWEKGCCTLCALVCHEGHDVSYSRYSSFFCDCGAEPSDSDDHCNPCSCLSPLKRETIERIEMLESRPHHPRSGSRKVQSQTIVNNRVSATILHDFIKVCDRGAWQEILFNQIQEELTKWTSSHSKSALLSKYNTLATSEPYAQWIPPALLQRRILSRNSKALTFTQIPGVPFTRPWVASLDERKVELDGSLVADVPHGKLRSLLVCDSRGRCIIGRNRELLFCNIGPHTLTRYDQSALSETKSREELCIQGVQQVGFDLLGLSMCPSNENLVTYWGRSVVEVAVLDQPWGTVVKTLNAAPPAALKEGEREQIVKSQWIPGSQMFVTATKDLTVHVYDVEKDKSAHLEPGMSHTLAGDGSLLDFTLVSCPGNETVKLFLLVDTGSVKIVELVLDPIRRFEAREGLPTPTNVTTSPLSTSCGYSQVEFLSQSRTLLCTTDSGGTIAFVVDRDGDTRVSFELIPNQLSHDPTSGESPLDLSLFQFWTELGIVYDANVAYFRTACIARSKNTSRSRLLIVDFNDFQTRLKDVPMDNCSLCTGMQAFSMPCDYEGLDGIKLGERTFLCTTTSSGEVVVYGESSSQTVCPRFKNENSPASWLVSKWTPCLPQSGVPNTPLTGFESLYNISDSEDVLFSSESFDCSAAQLKSRLSRDSNSTLTCQADKGCTIAISIRPNSTTSKSGSKSSQEKNTESVVKHTICGLRILFGSSSKFSPTKIRVQGRPIDIVPCSKKWYSVLLTDEEIAVGLRSGVVTFTIVPEPISTCEIAVDSIEVYAVGREDSGVKIKKAFFDKSDGTNGVPRLGAIVRNNVSVDDSRMLSLVLKATGKFCTITGPLLKKSDVGQIELLRNLVQATSLATDPELTETVRDIVNVSLSDSPERNVLYQENILRGCLNMLSEAQGTTGKHFFDVSSTSTSWNGLRKVLHDCLHKVVTFACESPMDYLHAVELVSSEGNREPVGVGCSRLILSALRRSLPCDDLLQSPSGIVDLCLAEIAIKHSTGSGTVLATFDILKRFLEAEPPCNELTCRTIGDFCERHGRTNVTSSLFSQLQERSLVAYQCDSCGVCPMKDERFTVLDDSFDIDLCRSCYNTALRFANENEGAPEVLVEIKGNYVGEVAHLTCGQVRRMQSVPLETMEVEQIEVETTVATSRGPSAFQGLQFSVDRFDGSKGEPFAESQVYDDFVTFIFSSVCELVTETLRRGGSDFQTRVLPMTRLLLELVRSSPSEKLKEERAQSFTESLACCLSTALDDALTEDTVETLSICVQSLQLLIEGGAQHVGDKSQTESRRKPPTILCQEHNMPAVRRRSSKGANKGRRFYVCGKDRGQRCNFFRWADDVDEPEPENQEISSSMKSRVHETLWNGTAITSPLHVRLCEAIDALFFKEQDSGTSGTSLSPTPPSSLRKKAVALKGEFSRIPRPNEERELADGVICSREKLCGFPVESQADAATRSRTPLTPPLRKKSVELLESSLGLLVHVADYKTSGVSRWFSLLCDIETSFGRSWEVRGMTRKALKLLCAKKKTVCHSVRNLLSFGYRLRKLYEYTTPLIAAGILIGEKCRVCKFDCTSARALDLSSLKTGDLIGVDELLVEGICDRSRLKRIGMVLDDLWNHVKSCEENWRQFCCLASLPVSNRHNESNDRCAGGDGFHYLSSNAPAVGLFWLACVLPVGNQRQVLRLLEIGLSRQGGGLGTANNRALGGTASTSKIDVDVLAILSTTTFSSMSQVLLANEKQLTEDDIANFIVHYVLHGKTADIRQVCHRLSESLLTSFSSLEKSELFLRLVSSCFGAIGMHGRGSQQFLSLLRALAKDLKPEQVNFVGGEVFDAFVNQLDSNRNGFANGLWFTLPRLESDEYRVNVLDFSVCTYCLKSPSSTGVESASLATRAGLLSRKSDDEKNGTSTSAKSSRTTREQNLEALVGPLSRSRLDTLKHSSSSDEFCTYFALKCRFVVSEVHISVRDPKGRYVKRINLYYSPRPSGDAAELKSDQMVKSWELCTSVVLPKGASRVHVVLPIAVTAANLKVEYAEFYERPGGSKSSTGAMLVHCPRCTRVVTNEHGVCGNCGEVAFQCRKCRHINYDRLDAFLCVECGYCSSGSFSFELLAGVASNAIAVCSDKECERALKMLGILNAVCQQLKSAIEGDTRKIGSSDATTLGRFDEVVGRAILGHPPNGMAPEDNKLDPYCDRLDKPGSVVRLVARPELCQSSGRPSGTSDRLRSLIRLARQLRDGASEADGRSGGDVVIRRHGLSLEGVDDERDLMDLIEGGSLVDSPGRDDRHRLSSRRTADSSTKLSNANDAEMRDDIEHCMSLYALLREASTERMLISRRVEAWQRLNKGYLVGNETHINENVYPVEPCHCSHCGVQVATELLLLWSEVFGASPNDVDVDREMLKILLSEETGNRILGSAKKQVAFDIATKSKRGAELVLKELRSILTATQDPTAAELLGRILSHDEFSMSLEYSDLAVQVLSTQAI